MDAICICLVSILHWFQNFHQRPRKSSISTNSESAENPDTPAASWTVMFQFSDEAETDDFRRGCLSAALSIDMGMCRVGVSQLFDSLHTAWIAAISNESNVVGNFLAGAVIRERNGFNRATQLTPLSKKERYCRQIDIPEIAFRDALCTRRTRPFGTPRWSSK